MPVIYGLNPFIHYPALIPYDTITSWIHPVWHYAPSVYGPLWIDFSVLMARISTDLSPADQIFLYRVTANVAHVLNAVLILALRVPACVSWPPGFYSMPGTQWWCLSSPRMVTTTR